MKKKLLMIVSVIIVILVLVFVFLIYPKITYNKDVSILENKIYLVKEYLINNTGDIKEIRNELKKESVSGSRLEIEKETNKYLNNVLDNVSELNMMLDGKINYIFSDEKFKDNLDNNIKFANSEKDKLAILKEATNELKEIDNKKIKDEDNKKLLLELFNDFKTDNLTKQVDDTIKYVDVIIQKLEFLKKNKNTWNYENNKIVFTKRASYNDYKSILSGESNEFELIKDTTGPVITASDITITKGTKINIKDKVKCEDSVDGKVECKITGNYDINKVGSYSIKITSSDQSNNTSSKTIKLNVKEKTVVNTNNNKTNNNKPYYIEVIRNHNVVVVYGLDSNNKYTKIVKVFICSVGKSSSKTPTGTFKTQDKAKWGWLVGNLYGQYYTRITGSILFHSVPYTKKAKNTLEWDEYNKLGTAASKGCVRMTVKDVKWIYDNCPRGTTVKIYDGNLPSGVSKPSAKKISSDSPNKGWDPTDPDKNNPWKK